MKGTVEDMDEDGHFLRKSVNDITCLLDINFGSLGRPSRGGRGRGARGGPTSRPERAKPMMERVGSRLFGRQDNHLDDLQLDRKWMTWLGVEVKGFVTLPEVPFI